MSCTSITFQLMRLFHVMLAGALVFLKPLSVFEVLADAATAAGQT